MPRRQDRDPTRADDAREPEAPLLEDEEALDEDDEDIELLGEEDQPEENRAPGRSGGGTPARKPGEAGSEGRTKRQEPGRSGEKGRRPAGDKSREPGRG